MHRHLLLSFNIVIFNMGFDNLNLILFLELLYRSTMKVERSWLRDRATFALAFATKRMI